MKQYLFENGDFMKITIKDIAKECGVSIATVSLALSDKPNRVSQETKTRIIEVVKRLKYTPNRAAVSLVTNRSKLIGVIISDLRNTHISSQFMAIDEELQNHGYTILCHILNENGSDMQKMVNDLVSTGVEGIIFAQPVILTPKKDDVSPGTFLDTAGVPVMCNDDFGLTCPGSDICFNFSKGGYLATKYLIECGHTRIGCLSGPADFHVTKSRLDGYKKALQEAGIPFEEDLIYQGDYSMSSGCKALSYLLGQNATAIFSFNDDMAFGLYQSARNYGVNIPSDISIMGCDNVPFSDVLEVPLSTINVPTEEMGRVLAKELINIIENGGPGERRTIMYEPALILRGSISRR